MNGANGPLPIDLWHVGAAGLLVLAAGAVSVSLRLRLERSLAVAALRCLVQLLLVGYVLRWVFGVRNPWVLAPVLLAMTYAASHAAAGRTARTYRGAQVHAFVTLLCGGMLLTAVTTGLILRVRPFWSPQYAVPLLGMVLGNALTGVSLTLDHLLESLEERRGEIETALALGATRWEAAAGPLAGAVRRGMVPTINSLSVTGVVSLPGMMTGQILSGTDPLLAVRYQIVVLFVLTAATALGCVSVALLACRALFNERHQLRAERLRPQGKAS
jgi:putative ABC transport system permease protein